MGGEMGAGVCGEAENGWLWLWECCAWASFDASCGLSIFGLEKTESGLEKTESGLWWI